MAVKKKYSSIHSRLLITSLLPLTLLCIVLASYMISSQRNVLLANLHNTGAVAAQQISSNAEFALYSNNPEMLMDLGESVLDIPAANGVLFYNASQDTSVAIGDLARDIIPVPDTYEFGKPLFIADHVLDLDDVAIHIILKNFDSLQRIMKQLAYEKLGITNSFSRTC